ncbi:MAG: hypothetical protein K0R59_1411 [Sphingobacterium sp.]|nr:hypothetical protein [Sphingobacterium sp.]
MIAIDKNEQSRGNSSFIGTHQFINKFPLALILQLVSVYLRKIIIRMKVINIGLSLLLFTVACQQSGKKQGDQVQLNRDTATTIAAVAEPGKYQYLKNGDTISLTIAIDGNRVHGDLSYRWKEKDRNIGHIDGVLKDSIVLADYTFASEGQQSVRQVAFKFSKNRAVEGFGNMEEKGGKMSFVAPDKLSYDEKFALEHVSQ